MFARCVLVQLERAFGHSLLGVHYHVERLPVDLDQLERVLGGVRALGDYGRDTRAGEGDPVELQRPRRVDEVLDTAGLPRARKRG
jgi:hypothetical protein